MKELSYVIGGIIALGIISRLFWKVAKKDFFGSGLTMTVNRKLPNWWKVAVKPLLSHKPEGLSFYGAFFTPLWVCLIGLNVLFLAQIFEVFIPGGSRQYFPLVGSYDTLSLAAGVLYAFAQLVFGVATKITPSRQARISFWVLLVVAIAVEAGLAYHRAKILNEGLIEGQVGVPLTMWDEITRKRGPELAGFLGVIIPFAEVTTGVYAVGEFIKPVAVGFIHWIGGVFALLWCVIIWWLFDREREKERVILDATTSDIKRQLSEISKDLETLKKKKESLENDKLNLENHRPTPYGDISRDADALQKRIEATDTLRKKDCNDLKDKIDHCEDPAILKGHLSTQRKNLMNQIKWDKISLSTDADNLYTEIASPEIFGRWQEKVTTYNNALDNLKKDIENLIDRLNKLDVKSLASPDPNIRVIQRNLQNDFDQLKKDADNLLSQINHLPSISPLPAIPKKQDEKNLKTDVLLLSDDVSNFYRNRKKDAKRLKSDIRKRLKELGVPWYGRLFVGFALAVLMVLSTSGSSSASKLWNQPGPLCVIVLVDETGSFGLRESTGRVSTHFWDEIIPRVQEVVNLLRPGDCFALIGIDGHGFDTEDVRIPQLFVNRATLRAVVEKRNLSQRVRNLQRRQGTTLTDILGALYHSAQLLRETQKQYPEYRGVVVVFSDMLQTASWNMHQTRIEFPQGTRGIFFYVNATGASEWQRLVDTWTNILQGLNLQILGFYQRGQTNLGFQRLREILR